MKAFINANQVLKYSLDLLHSFVIKVTDSPLRTGALTNIVKSMIANRAVPVAVKLKRSAVGTYLSQTLPSSGQLTEDLTLLKPVKTRWGSGINEVARFDRFGTAPLLLIASREAEFSEFINMATSWIKPFLRITAFPLELTARFQVLLLFIPIIISI